VLNTLYPVSKSPPLLFFTIIRNGHAAEAVFRRYLPHFAGILKMIILLSSVNFSAFDTAYWGKFKISPTPCIWRPRWRGSLAIEYRTVVIKLKTKLELWRYRAEQEIWRYLSNFFSRISLITLQPFDIERRNSALQDNTCKGEVYL